MKVVVVRVKQYLFSERAQEIRNSILPSRRPGATVVEIETDDGLLGHAVTAGRAGFGSRHFVEGPLRDQVVGQDPINHEHLWDAMIRGWRKPITKGELISSLSGVDIALWDLRAKALDIPMYRLLGGYRDEVHVYAAGGYYASGKGQLELVNEMKHYVSLGYRAVKMKVGGAALREDVARVAAVREAVGPGIRVMLDANCSWKAHEALEFMRIVEEFNPFWIEEPVHPDDVDGCARVRNQGTIPVAAGENEFTRFGSMRLLTSQAVDFLQVDANVGGGVTEWTKIASLADAHHIEMAPHGDHYTHLHLVASVPNGRYVEVYPTIHEELHRLLGGPSVVAGKAKLSERAGFGLQIDDEKLAPYLVS